MLHHDIHEKLLAYTDRELELLRANYQLCHKFKSHMERRFFKDNYIHIEKQTRFTKIPLHSHGFIELIYIYQGKMHQKINEESLTLGKGEILLINQFARHEIEAAGQN
ncbi:AraC family ligand binding domain-containing protein, partial [Klebsiella grimontii]